MQGRGQVLVRDAGLAGQVGDGAGHLPHAVEAARAQGPRTEPALEQVTSGAVDGDGLVESVAAQLGVARDASVAGGVRTRGKGRWERGSKRRKG